MVGDPVEVVIKNAVEELADEVPQSNRSAAVRPAVTPPPHIEAKCAHLLLQAAEVSTAPSASDSCDPDQAPESDAMESSAPLTREEVSTLDYLLVQSFA